MINYVVLSKITIYLVSFYFILHLFYLYYCLGPDFCRWQTSRNPDFQISPNIKFSILLYDFSYKIQICAFCQLRFREQSPFLVIKHCIHAESGGYALFASSTSKGTITNPWDFYVAPRGVMIWKIQLNTSLADLFFQIP